LVRNAESKILLIPVKKERKGLNEVGVVLTDTPAYSVVGECQLRNPKDERRSFFGSLPISEEDEASCAGRWGTAGSQCRSNERESILNGHGSLRVPLRYWSIKGEKVGRGRRQFVRESGKGVEKFEIVSAEGGKGLAKGSLLPCALTSKGKDREKSGLSHTNL